MHAKKCRNWETHARTFDSNPDGSQNREGRWQGNARLVAQRPSPAVDARVEKYARVSRSQFAKTSRHSARLLGPVAPFDRHADNFSLQRLIHPFEHGFYEDATHAQRHVLHDARLPTTFPPVVLIMVVVERGWRFWERWLLRHHDTLHHNLREVQYLCGKDDVGLIDFFGDDGLVAEAASGQGRSGWFGRRRGWRWLGYSFSIVEGAKGPRGWGETCGDQPELQRRHHHECQKRSKDWYRHFFKLSSQIVSTFIVKLFNWIWFYWPFSTFTHPESLTRRNI